MYTMLTLPCNVFIHRYNVGTEPMLDSDGYILATFWFSKYKKDFWCSALSLDCHLIYRLHQIAKSSASYIM